MVNAKKINVFVCDHNDCQQATRGYENLDDLTKHQEQDHSITYTEYEIFKCDECKRKYTDEQEAETCCSELERYN